ncbi:Hpt domain-containing protein [Pseudomonas syringae]|uniref:Hpt domain-containing protein n=1 Tax=Pseudomonas syringae CC1417 TaxID=1357272 RepID=A0AAU8LDX4_PSESX
MPVMNGYDLTRGIRAHEQSLTLEPCPVWGFTANAQPEEIHRCLDAGMNDCLFKPISLALLSEKLAHLEPVVHTAPAFNLSSVHSLTGERPEMVKRLLAQLLQSNREDRQLLATLMLEGRRNDVREMAHRIKGAARIISAAQVVKACDALEAACEPDATDAQLQAAHEVVNTTMIELERALVAQQSKVETPGHPAS